MTSDKMAEGKESPILVQHEGVGDREAQTSPVVAGFLEELMALMIAQTEQTRVEVLAKQLRHLDYHTPRQSRQLVMMQEGILQVEEELGMMLPLVWRVWM